MSAGSLYGVHPRGVSVAAIAGLGDHGRRHGGPHVLDGEDPVRAVAARALGDEEVSPAQLLAVHAGPVLRELIHADRRVEALHEGGVGMALPAEQRDFGPRRLAEKSLPPIVRLLLVLLRRVAAVAGRAGKAGLDVDVIRGRPGRRREPRVVEHEVAFETAVDRRPAASPGAPRTCGPCRRRRARAPARRSFMMASSRAEGGAKARSGPPRRAAPGSPPRSRSGRAGVARNSDRAAARSSRPERARPERERRSSRPARRRSWREGT